MKNKIIQFVLAIITFLIIGFRYFSTWCIDSISFCYGSWVHQIYQYFTYPLYSFSLFILPITIILAFVPRSMFNSWLKFSAWAIPLAIIFIAITPVIDTSLLPFSRDDAARLVGGLFAIISLLLIIYKYFSSRFARP